DAGGPDDEAAREQLRALREQLAQTPVADIVANHAIGLWELALLHLSAEEGTEPDLEEAGLAIDGVGAPVEGWEARPGRPPAPRRRYRDDALVLETEFETPEGAVRIIDFMPIRDQTVDVVRIVEGLRGHVPMQMHLTIRFDYGQTIPWVRNIGGALVAVAGPDALVLRAPVETKGVGHSTVAEFTVRAGQRVPFNLAWYPSHQDLPRPRNATWALSRTESWWHSWSKQWTYDGAYPEVVQRSVITLKALTYAPTGGIVAAPTTSLPEWIGGVRNWDYRFCWLRDATFTLLSLLHAGYEEEAKAWRGWLLRAVAGEPSDLQIMYGAARERRLTAWEVPWLPG